ncbi:MAG: 3-(3-hydroxy-phenyl)propionate transporter MhpT [Gammaproteobacteria bacterium]|nr:3-(3-hydroxy-phenyl)propionate transporter MhpT [Gammaproteobacteria bacterium]
MALEMTSTGANSTDTMTTNWLTLGLCFAATVLEGLDLQSMGVAATGLVKEYNLSSGEMGVIASASSVGLLIGALIGGMISDRIGRKQVLIASVALFGFCSLATPFTWDAASLIGIRFITGLGMGGALPMIIAIAAEAVKPSHRAGTVTMMYCATPLGGFLATAIALSTHDWRMIFYAGGLAPLVLVPVLIRYLSESEVFKQAKALARTADRADTHGLGHTLFAEGRLVPTAMIWIGFLCSVAVLYLLLNWMPLLLVGKGFTSAEASTVQLVFNVGGSTGALFLGWLITRMNQRAVFAAVCVAIAGALIGLAMLDHNMTGAVVAGLVVGIFANGFVFLLYGQAGAYYPTAIRGTGVGWAVALGRMGAIIGPLLAGILLSSDQTSSDVLMSILPLVVVAAIAVQVLLSTPRPEE